MLQYLNQKRGQSTLEYAVLILIIIAALISIQMYMKRGFQGRLKQASDDIGDQYSPGNMNESKITKRYSNSTEISNRGTSSSELRTEKTNTETHSNILNLEQEYWGK